MYIKYIIRAIARYTIKTNFELLTNQLADWKYIDKNFNLLTSQLNKKF